MFRMKSFRMGIRKVESSSSLTSNSSSTNATMDYKAYAKIGVCTLEGKNHANEDRYYISDDLSKLENLEKAKFNESISFVGVYDGHGGSGCSDFLSKSLHRNIATNEKFQSFSDSSKVLYESFIETDNEFLSIAKGSSDTSGSCAAVALINGLDITVAHCGDCRAVVKSDKGVVELTRDHRPTRPSERSRIVSAGGRIIGGRVAGVLAPSRSFGDLDVKSIVASNVVIPEPETISYRAELGKDNHAYLVLATDGVWDAMSNDKAMAIVVKAFTKSNDPQKAAAALAEASASLNADDVTVIVVVWSIDPLSTSVSAQTQMPSVGITSVVPSVKGSISSGIDSVDTSPSTETSQEPNAKKSKELETTSTALMTSMEFILESKRDG